MDLHIIYYTTTNFILIPNALSISISICTHIKFNKLNCTSAGIFYGPRSFNSTFLLIHVPDYSGVGSKLIVEGGGARLIRRFDQKKCIWLWPYKTLQHKGSDAYRLNKARCQL